KVDLAETIDELGIEPQWIGLAGLDGRQDQHAVERVETRKARCSGFLGQERHGENDDEMNDAAKQDATDEPEQGADHGQPLRRMTGMVSLPAPRPEKAVVS